MTSELTPWQNRNGMWYKREDLYRSEEYGVNGAKFRACQHLMQDAVDQGYDHVVTAQSVLSPQAAMTAVIAERLGMKCTVIVGGTTPDKAVKHKSIAIAASAGAQVESIAVGYNPALQKAGKTLSESLGAWQMPYGITTPRDAPREDVEAFLNVGGEQVQNLPAKVETLVVPFGSGNTAAGVLYGLSRYGCKNVQKVVLVGIGPNREEWLRDRIYSVILAGRSDLEFGPIPELEPLSLHGWFAEYGDRMPETLDGIEMHPTYEGKVVRFMNGAQPDYWTRRDGTTALWIVGGPI